MSFFRELIRERRQDVERLDEKIEELRQERQSYLAERDRTLDEINELQSFVDWKAANP